MTICLAAANGSIERQANSTRRPRSTFRANSGVPAELAASSSVDNNEDTARSNGSRQITTASCPFDGESVISSASTATVALLMSREVSAATAAALARPS